MMSGRRYKGWRDEIKNGWWLLVASRVVKHCCSLPDCGPHCFRVHYTNYCGPRFLFVHALIKKIRINMIIISVYLLPTWNLFYMEIVFNFYTVCLYSDINTSIKCCVAVLYIYNFRHIFIFF